MIDHALLLQDVPDLDPRDLQHWISCAWVRADSAEGRYTFEQIDVARVRLIQELSVDLQVGDDALPLVLSLLDQLYDARRRTRELGEAIALIAPEDMCRDVIRLLATGER